MVRLERVPLSPRRKPRRIEDEGDVVAEKVVNMSGSVEAEVGVPASLPARRFYPSGAGKNCQGGSLDYLCYMQFLNFI